MVKSFLFILSLQFVTGCASFLDFFKSSTAGQSSRSAFPPRAANAITGSQFIKNTASLSADARDQAIYMELSKGNIPSFLRIAKPVRTSHVINGKSVQGVVYVLPDYLCIGSDRDFIRIPMTPIVAQKLADQFGFILPTRKLVDAIYQQADIKLPPSPMPAGPLMVTNNYYSRHQTTIESQLAGRSHTKLLAGHKKDIVITNRLNGLPHRVAIYGWHRLNGVAIQPLSLVHGNHYADYSHGVRMIQSVMLVGSYKMFVSDVLKNAKYAGLVSDEGAIANPKARTY